MNLIKRLFEKPKPLEAMKLYSPGDVPDSLETLEASLERLRRVQPLVKHRDLIQDMIEYEMELAQRVLTDPNHPQETRQFFGGAFWLVKQIGQKLNGLDDEIARKEKELTDRKKKAGKLYSVGG
jgi:hypothetical protein